MIDPFTSAHPARNAVAILVIIALAETAADIFVWVMS
jgi:hypothetical protein